MFIPFNQLPGTARVWIYQAARPLTAEDLNFTRQFLHDYCSKWAAHGQPLHASFDIRYNQFIIMSVDESAHGASGCSIDDSVRAIQHIQKERNIDLFNRTLVPFKTENGVTLVDLKDLKKMWQSGIWNEHTITFNNLVPNRASLEREWEIAAGASWLKRYIPKEVVKN